MFFFLDMIFPLLVIIFISLSGGFCSYILFSNFPRCNMNSQFHGVLM